MWWWWMAAALAAEPMPVEEMHAALAEIRSTLHAVHPEPFAARSEVEQARAFTRALKATRKPLPAPQFAAVATGLVAALSDAHTSLTYTGADDRWLPARFVWAHDGLGIAAGPAVGEVARLGGLRPDQLLGRLASIVPAENPHWVRARGEHLLAARSTWIAMGLDRDEIEVALTDGSTHTLAFDRPQRTVAPPVGPDIWWATAPDANLAWLRLASCPSPTPAYEASIADLFHQIHALGLDTLVIDVRGNGGGDSAILNPILGYLPPDAVQGYGGVRRLSEAAIQQRSLEPSKYAMQPGTDLTEPLSGPIQKSRRHRRLSPFTGQVYVLVDAGTFSSGKWVAVVLSDNGLAETVGEPTGNAPSAYGDVLRFDIGEQLRLSVSYTKWLRPDPGRDPATTLEPDHLVPTGLRDRLEGHDPVWTWLLERSGGDAELPPPGPDLSLVPRVVRSFPAAGEVDVDPSLDTLVLEFSEPISPEGMALVGGGPTFPTLRGDPKWVWASPTTLHVHVELVPDNEYRFWANTPRYEGFRALDGTPAAPYEWRFTTRAR